jgi:hypothetical protein
MLSRLLERTGNSAHGHCTALYTCLVAGDDLEDPVADEVRSLLDGHVVLDRRIAERGRWPAVDVLASLSRVMPQVTSPEQRQLAARMRALLAAYEERRDLIVLGAYQPGTDALVDEAIERRAALEAFLAQAPDAPAGDVWGLLRAAVVDELESLDALRALRRSARRQAERDSARATGLRAAEEQAARCAERRRASRAGSMSPARLAVLERVLAPRSAGPAVRDTRAAAQAESPARLRTAAGALRVVESIGQVANRRALLRAAGFSRGGSSPVARRGGDTFDGARSGRRRRWRWARRGTRQPGGREAATSVTPRPAALKASAGASSLRTPGGEELLLLPRAGLGMLTVGDPLRPASVRVISLFPVPLNSKITSSIRLPVPIGAPTMAWSPPRWRGRRRRSAAAQRRLSTPPVRCGPSGRPLLKARASR